MKETYPRPTNQKPTLVRVNDTPEFGSTLEEWHERIFRTATHFSVWRFGYVHGGESCVVKSFAEAVYIAHHDERSLVYAMNSSQGFCVPRKDWEKFAKIWLERHDVERH